MPHWGRQWLLKNANNAAAGSVADSKLANNNKIAGAMPGQDAA